MINLKKKIKNKEVTFGSWMNIGNAYIAEIMVQAGFDWIVIDMEHTAITYEDQQRLIQTIELAGSIPLVRVDSNNEVSIKKALDAGAHGIIVPMINNESDALRAVSYTYYPPRGIRGVGLSRAQKYGFGFDAYKKWLKSECVVIAQIESVKALDELEKILTVEGIDGFIIGPYDLSASIGYPGEYDRKEVADALSKVEAISDRINATKGYHVVNVENNKVENLVRSGYSFIALGVDEIFLGSACRAAIENSKKIGGK